MNMASLTEISTISRKSIRFGIYALIVILIARFVFNFGVGLYRKIFPPKAPEPTITFGKLPAIPFPEREDFGTVSYSLETVDGKYPELLDQIPVYFMPPISSSIDIVEAAQSKASKLGFDPNGKPIVESVKNIYIFNKSNTPSTLTMNIISGVFSISYNLSVNPFVVSATPINSDQAIGQVRSYFSSVSDPNEINDRVATHQFLKVESGGFTEVDSQSESNLVKVNLFRKNLGEETDIPSVSPDMPEANLWAIVSGSRTIIAAEYHYFPVDLQRSGTYPLKTAETAWNELQNGEAFIANMGSNSGQVTIRRIYLAYYDAGQYTEFYQPVIVFEGDGGFYAYVPAVTPEHYGAEIETSE